MTRQVLQGIDETKPYDMPARRHVGPPDCSMVGSSDSGFADSPAPQRDASSAPLHSRFYLPMRRSSFLVRIILIGILLHIYVGLRLIPDMPIDAAGRWLCAL